MSKIEVDNSGAGNCMYYAYSISLMYFLRQKNDKPTAEIFFNRLGLSLPQKEKLHNLLENDTNKPFSSSNITQIIEPILAPAARKLAADSSKKNYLDKRDASGLFAAANYGMVYYCKLFLENADLDLSKLLAANKFNNTRYTEAEIFRVNGIKNEMQKFLSVHGWEVIEEFEQGWPAEAQRIFEENNGARTLQQIETDNFHKKNFLEEVIGSKTMIFLEENENARLNNYIAHINTDRRWGTDEILGLLHHEMQGEIPQDGTNGYVDTLYEMAVNLHIYKDGVATTPVKGTPDIVLNNRHNTHWTSFIASDVLKEDKTIDAKTKVDKTKDDKTSIAKKSEKNDGVTQKKDEVKPSTISTKKASDVKSGTSPSKKPEVDKKPIITKDPVTAKKEPSVVPTQSKVLISAKEQERKLQLLQRMVKTASMAYCDYSSGIWFSFFHRHGETGRVRARDFAKLFSAIKDYDKAKVALIDFLKNQKNGNTHPHSFRTMLLHEVLDSKEKESYKNTSDNFNSKMEVFANEDTEIKQKPQPFTL